MFMPKHKCVFFASLTLPPGWAGSYTCPALRPYQLGRMRILECNHKVTGSGYKVLKRRL